MIKTGILPIVKNRELLVHMHALPLPLDTKALLNTLADLGASGYCFTVLNNRVSAEFGTYCWLMLFVSGVALQF